MVFECISALEVCYERNMLYPCFTYLVTYLFVCRLFRCRFKWNQAGDGGALYMTLSSEVLMSGCQFSDNSAASVTQPSYASRGGAMYVESSSKTQLIDCSFVNNTAQFSASALFATDATALSLIRCTFIEANSSSWLPGPESSILSLSAGAERGPEYVNKLTDCHIESGVLHGHVLVSLGGPTNINNSSVSCQSNSVSLRHASIPDAESQLRQLAVWSQDLCPSGFYAPRTNSACHLTLQGRLADLNDTAEQLCRACPTHAQCDNAVVRADYNYYALESGDGLYKVLLCPDGNCQPIGGQMCTDGRTGLVCSGCQDDRVTSLHFNDVIGCESRGSCIDYTSSSVVIVVFTVIYVVVLLLLRWLTTSQEHHGTPQHTPLHNTPRHSQLESLPPASSRFPAISGHVDAGRSLIGCSTGHMTASRSLIGCVFALVFFYQLLPSVYPRLMRSSWWLDRTIQFVTSLFHLYPPVVGAGRGLCLDDLTSGISTIGEQRYFITMSIYWSQLVLILLLFLVLSLVFLFNRGPFTEQNIKMLVTYFLPAFLFFQMFSNVPLLRSNLQSIHCVQFNSSSVLVSDATTPCFSSWQAFSLVYAVVCVAPLCLVVDTGAFLLSRGRVSVLGYIGLCLFPLLGLVVIPAKNLRRRGRQGDAQETRDEFEVDHTTPEGLRGVSDHSIVMVQSVIIKPFNSYLPLSVVDVGWLTITLVRNFTICTLSVLLQSSPSLRSVVVSLLCLFFTADQFICRGFALPVANWFAVTSWFLLTLLSTSDIYVSVLYEAGQSLSTWSTIDWFARFMSSLPFIVVVVIIVVKLLNRVVRRRRRSRRI